MWEYNQTQSNELYHHGVLGMKWGVRRSKTQLSGKASSSRTKSKAGDDEKEKKPTKKSVKDMTDDELRDAIARKRLEKDYASLNPEKVSAGKRFANAAMNKVIIPAVQDAGKQVATNFLKDQGMKLLKLPSDSGNKDKK